LASVDKQAPRQPDRAPEKLARIQTLNQRLNRAYLLAQQPGEIYRVGFDDAIALLEAWLKRSRRCRLEPFVKLARTITEQRPGIDAALQHGLSNARVEQVNTQLRLIIRRGFGFHSYHAPVALAMLALGGLCPSLPGRWHHPRLLQEIRIGAVDSVERQHDLVAIGESVFHRDSALRDRSACSA
jgi:Transposase